MTSLSLVSRLLMTIGALLVKLAGTEAAVTINVVEQDGNVVAEGMGTLDMDALTTILTATPESGTFPSYGSFVVGAADDSLVPFHFG